MLNFFKAQWLFLQELKSNPGAIGAAFPSSRELGKVMAEQIPENTTGLIVELGAGTGSITKALQKKFPNKQLVIIERAKDLYEYLKRHYLGVEVILGDAIDLAKLLESFKEPVQAIVSSLPLRSLDKKVVDQIQKAALECLAEDGIFIQFTYDPRDNAAEVLPEFKHLYHKKVWCNLPPAKVDVYKKCL